MNQLKRLLGIVWMVAGPVMLIFLIGTAIEEIKKKPTVDTMIQWAVFVVVSIPIGIGLVLFGWYALKGAYKHLPVSSAEIKEEN